MFTCTDTFSGSRRREGSVCEARSARDGRAFARAEGSSAVKGRVGRVLETSRERQKPTTLRLVFDGRKGGESRKREFDRRKGSCGPHGNGRRVRTTFNTVEGYRLRVDEGDLTLERVLVIFIDPVEFAVKGESSHLFPDVNDPTWRCTWENVRPDLAPHFKPKMNFDSSRMFTCTDTFSGSRRREGSVCEARSARDGRAFARAEGSSAVKGRVGRVLETPKERLKPSTQRLVFDGRENRRESNLESSINSTS